MKTAQIERRLEEIRIEIRAERISLGEIAELESLSKHIDKNDVELLEWAGVDEFEEDETEYTLDDETINDIVINERIRQEELFEYQIIHRESFIDELIGWIYEANSCGRSSSFVMKEDLKHLFTLEDEYIFSSVLTNKYVCKSDDDFNEICEELLELNNSLK